MTQKIDNRLGAKFRISERKKKKNVVNRPEQKKNKDRKKINQNGCNKKETLFCYKI